MERTYDLFEILADGSPVWRVTVEGHSNAIAKLDEIASQTQNEVRVMHLPTNSVVAVMNNRKG
jgi:hypothetical protein